MCACMGEGEVIGAVAPHYETVRTVYQKYIYWYFNETILISYNFSIQDSAVA